MTHPLTPLPSVPPVKPQALWQPCEWVCVYLCTNESGGLLSCICLVTKDTGISRSASRHFLVVVLFRNPEPAGLQSPRWEGSSFEGKGLGEMRRLHAFASVSLVLLRKSIRIADAGGLPERYLEEARCVLPAPGRKYTGEFCVPAMLCEWWTWKGGQPYPSSKWRPPGLCYVLVLCWSFLNWLFISPLSLSVSPLNKYNHKRLWNIKDPVSS